MKKTKVRHASRTEITRRIKETNGRICTITYKTKDGEVRVMNCNTKGATTELGYLLVNDMQVKKTKDDPKPNRIRSVDPRTISEFKFGGKVYQPKD